MDDCTEVRVLRLKKIVGALRKASPSEPNQGDTWAEGTEFLFVSRGGHTQLAKAGHPVLGVPGSNDLPVLDFVDVDRLN